MSDKYSRGWKEEKKRRKKWERDHKKLKKKRKGDGSK